MLQLDWPAIVHDLGLGHPLKFIWEEITGESYRGVKARKLASKKKEA